MFLFLLDYFLSLEVLMGSSRLVPVCASVDGGRA
jgi:hypothetical protein